MELVGASTERCPPIRDTAPCPPRKTSSDTGLSTKRSLPQVLACLSLLVISVASLHGADAAKAGEWKALFDGRTTNGWHSFKKQTFPEKGWVVDPDGSLHHLDKGGGGDLISDAAFDNFELEWDWKIAPGANSGLKYLVSEDRQQVLGHEYQIIDDTKHADGQRGPKWQTAAFYDVLPPRDTRVKPAGEWNRSRIVVQGDQVEHWLNGVKVLEYTLGSPEVLAAVAKSKFKSVTNPKLRDEIFRPSSTPGSRRRDLVPQYSPA